MVHTPAPSATTLWPPDDTEESIVGVDRHQLDIISLRTGINEEAHRVSGNAAVRWQAVSQIRYVGCVRPDGSPYTVYPDVCVFARPMERTRGSYSLAQDGRPVLIVEVASDATSRADLDLERGKGWSYAQVGVAEYLVLDPTGALVPGEGQGWRLERGVYVPWERDERGRWRSGMIGVSLGVAQGLAAVYGADGRRQLREGEVLPALETRRAEGRVAGQVEGKRETLRRLLRLRFGVVGSLERRLDLAGEAELDALIARVLTASGPDDL